MCAACTQCVPCGNTAWRDLSSSANQLGIVLQSHIVFVTSPGNEVIDAFEIHDAKGVIIEAMVYNINN